jgi:hypothetical protein
MGASFKPAAAISLAEHGRALQIAAFGMASPEQRTAVATEAIQKLLEEEKNDRKLKKPASGFPGN